MKTSINHRIRLLAAVVPCLFLIVLFTSSILRGEEFRKMVYGDGQMFYRRFASPTIYYGVSHTTPPNYNFWDQSHTERHYYYYLLDSAGFNYCITELVDEGGGENPYDSIGVYFEWTPLYYHPASFYARGQQGIFEVGTPPIQRDSVYFPEPHDSWAGESGPDPVQNWRHVFISDPSTNSAGYLIDDTIWEDYGPDSMFYLEMDMKIDTNGCNLDTNTLVIRVAFGTQSMLGDDWVYERFYDFPISLQQAYEDSSFMQSGEMDSTDDLQLIALQVSDLDTQYTTWTHAHSFNVTARDRFRLKVYWYGTVKFYLDEVRIYDERYKDLILSPVSSIGSQIVYDARALNPNQDYINAMDCHEPTRLNFRAVAAVDDTLEAHYNGKRMVPLQMFLDTLDFSRYVEYADYTGQPVPFILTDFYELNNDVLYTSTGDSNLQEAWDKLVHDWGYRPGLPSYSRRLRHGLRDIAEWSRNHNGYPWVPFVQISDYCEYYSSDSSFHRWQRDPAPNEIICEGWMFLCFGADGFAYFTGAPGYNIYWEGGLRWLRLNDLNSSKGFVQNTGIFDFKIGDEQRFPNSPNDFPSALQYGFFVPNQKYDAVKELHSDVDCIDSIYQQLDWVNSFCTSDGPLGQTAYSYIDSVWTVGDDHGPSPTPPFYINIDSTFVQVGAFNNPSDPDPLAKYFMLVNRRCLPSESRTVHFRLDFGQPNRNRCLRMNNYIDYPPGVGTAILTDNTGHLEASLDSVAPGHGKLISIRGLFDPTAPLPEIDWYSDSTHFVTDTLEITGTLRIHPGTLVKICDCSAGIIVKPGGHLAILGTPDSMVTIEGVNPDSLNANIKLCGSGTDTIQYCNISNLNYGISYGVKRIVVLKHCNISNCNTGVFSVGDGTLKMDSCTVAGSHWEGVFLAEGDEGRIRACTITGSGECGIRLHGVKSTFRLGYNSIDGNCSNLDSTLEAVHTYNCSPEIYANYIENNHQDGMGMYNDSYPAMNKNPEDENRAGENRVTKDGTPESNRLIYMNSSAGVVITGHNDIFNTEPDTTALMVGEKMPTDAYKIYYNYYGEWQNEPSWAFDFDCAYSWSPKDKDPNTYSLINDPPGFAFNQALYLENQELWMQATVAYFNLVRNYPSSYLAQASLERILGCYQEVNGNIPVLQTAFETIRDTTHYQHLFHTARQLAIKCLTARRQYDQAISRLETILQTPNIAFEDSLYALIDIASVHMLAYYDSLVCSWDPECDSLAGIMSAGGSFQRISQPVASAQSASGNNRRVSPSTSNRRISHPATITRSTGTNIPPTLTHVSTPEGSPIDFGGIYALEPASYPINYIAALRPSNEQDYQQRVRNLLAELRGIETGQNGPQAPPIPENYFLAQNYPNPFNPITTISYGLPEAAHVKITVYDILGRKVITLVDTDQPAGYHRSLWDSKSHQGITVSSGIYFYRLEANNFTDVKKMVLLR